MENTTQRVCWPSPDHYVIGAQVKNLKGQLHSAQVWAVLDTAYDGELLLSYNLYEWLELGVWQYPEKYWSVGLTASGEKLVMPLSRAYLVIGKLGREFEVLVDTFQGNTEFLIGRTFMRRFRFELGGPESKTCLIVG
jgi:hypothetical protein